MSMNDKEFIKDEVTLSPFESASQELLKGHMDDVLETIAKIS